MSRIIIFSALLATFVALVVANYHYECPHHVIHKTKTVKVPYAVVKKIPEVKIIKVPYKVPVPVKVIIPIKEEKYEHKEHYGHEEHGYGKHDDYKKA